MTAILSIMLAVILTNNYVLAQFLGICPSPGRIQEAGLRCRYGCSCNVRNAAGDGCDLADPDVRIKYFQHRLSADAGIHPGNRISGTAGRNDAEEIHASALQFAGCIPAADHD